MLGVSLAANVSTTASAQKAQFSSPAAAEAYASSGDMDASLNLSEVAKSVLEGNPSTMAQTAGCTVSCTVTCSTGCTVSCTTRCTIRCQQ